jgi:putative spermidine/putrescine transport system ATP-binding protein
VTRAGGTEFEQLTVRGLSRRYGRITALDSLDLTVPQGQFVALLGPSGCGKSTALSCVAGLQQPTSGEIWLDGNRIDTLPPERRGFGMVFQNYALFPHLTVARNVAFGLEVRGAKKDHVAERVSWALGLVQLADYGKHYPAQMSGGQQQRVAIARALAPQPPVVLMDEPLSNLDAKLRMEMRTEIRRLHDELRLTTLYVTHDQEEALSVADRLVVLRAGVVMQDDTPEQVYSRPASPYVADFMGYRNLLDARVTAGGGDTAEVSTHGVTVRGGAIGELNTSAAVVAIRPDDIEVGAGAAANAFEVVVRSVQYQGREIAADVELPDGRRLFVRTSVRVRVGDTIPVSVPVDRVLVYPVLTNSSADGRAMASAEPASEVVA